MPTFLALLVVLLGELAFAGVRPASAASDVSCEAAADQAETAWGIPVGLLRSIGLQESGKRGVIWPWTLNVKGEAFYFQSRQAALDALAKALPATHLVDVGCFQVNVKYHADRLGDPRLLFDPETNAGYAAWHLRELKDKYGDWTRAVEFYHSSDPVRRNAYVCSVGRRFAKQRGEAFSLPERCR